MQALRGQAEDQQEAAGVFVRKGEGGTTGMHTSCNSVQEDECAKPWLMLAH